MFSRLLTLSSLSNKILRTGSTMLIRSQKLSVVESVLNVDHNELDNEFIVRLNSHSAVLEYERDGNIMKINHTEVPEIFGGKGVGSKLAKVSMTNDAFFLKVNFLHFVSGCTRLWSSKQSKDSNILRFCSKLL